MNDEEAGRESRCGFRGESGRRLIRLIGRANVGAWLFQALFIHPRWRFGLVSGGTIDISRPKGVGSDGWRDIIIGG